MNIWSYVIPRAPERFFRLVPKTRRIDIVPQIELGTTFVDEAFAHGIIAKRRPLLIIGAGVTGVAAGVGAARRGVPVTIKDRSRFPFSPQSRTHSRILHPFQYEWPSERYGSPDYPGPTPEHPLRWKHGAASRIAGDWTAQFAEYVTEANAQSELRPDRLIETQFEEDISIPVNERSWALFIREHDPYLEYGAYVFCTGFRENSSNGSFSGYQFWSTDPYAAQHYDLAPERRKVLISGGGDGAQQDLLRLATKLRPGELMARIQAVAAGNSKWQNQWRRMVQRVESRLDVSGASSENFSASVETLTNFGNETLWRAIADSISDVLRPDFYPQGVTFAFKGDYPKQVFALNRVLVEFLRGTLIDKCSHDIFSRNTTVDRIAADERHGCGAPEKCHGVLHRVTFIRNGKPVDEDFHIVILRHGAKVN